MTTRASNERSDRADGPRNILEPVYGLTGHVSEESGELKAPTSVEATVNVPDGIRYRGGTDRTVAERVDGGLECGAR